MKREYKKPTLLIEDFRMDVSIATSCESSSMEFQAQYDALKQMYPDYSDSQIIDIINTQSGSGTYCYHTSQGTQVFNS